MHAFEYTSPATADLAVKALAGGPDSAILAGGTDLINRMKDEVTSPARIVHIAGIKTLAGIDGETIGAATTLAALVENKTIKDKYPALWQAASEVGAVQLRNMATVGGNLLQRPRCWYYRTGNGLMAMKDGKSLVREGDNRYHSIFMTEGNNALFVAPSSLAVALIALGAKATILGADGKDRTVAIEELYSIPKAEGESELTIGKGEILTKVILPKIVGKSASYEAREKASYDWPLAIASVHVVLEGDTVKTARIVLGSVAPVPLRCESAEAALIGKSLTMETASAAALAAVKSAKPLSGNAYKVKLAEVAVKRALLAAVGKIYWEA